MKNNKVILTKLWRWLERKELIYGTNSHLGKAALTLEEAAAYFNIGINQLRKLTNSKEYEKYVLIVGDKRLIKRKPFEKIVESSYSI